MLFFGKKKSSQEGRGESEAFPQAIGEFFRIEFDMLLKGSVYKRRTGEIKQIGVTVNGATKLVTSGDLVDKDTLKALVAAGAIRSPRVESRREPVPPPSPPRPAPSPAATESRPSIPNDSTTPAKKNRGPAV